MYNHSEIEQKWQGIWARDGAFVARSSERPKYYVLDMFPYPSGIGLHVGHLKGYVASDVISRYKRARGFEVLHPMGWDSFGLPTERQAQKEGIRPEEVTRRNVAAFRKQLDQVGLSYDWSRELATSSPDYYRWTQWIFSKLYEKGLAYTREMTVNWCPAMQTVLANEEVVDGKYVETGDLVERRTMKQWMLRITAYADRLLDDLDLIDWPEAIKRMQRHWIGRSEGAQITFRLEGRQDTLQVFTTRPDTLFGVTYMVIAPEHALIDELLAGAEGDALAELRAYVTEARNRSDMERQERAGGERTGVPTGLSAINPATGEAIPVWTSDYVLGGYGTGAVMAVAAHDDRDFAFAKTFGLPMREVVVAAEHYPTPQLSANPSAAFTAAGRCIQSSCDGVSLDGLQTPEAKQAIIAWLEKTGQGERQVNFKLRDWLFSRQRYWGEPFPVLHGKDGELRLVPEDALPVELPFVELSDQQVVDTAASGSEPVFPLDKAPESWLHVNLDGKVYRRETNTMPQWAGSCWYYLRFIDPHNSKALCDPEQERYWMPVDLYVGGAEHATLHLLYARFWHKVLFDLGLVTQPEPFQRLFTQGMIHATSYRDGRGKYYYPDEVEPKGEGFVTKATGEEVTTLVEKMSKSKCNGVPPETVIEKYGADALRLYEVFMGPVEDGGHWDDTGVRGTRRFLERLWNLFESQSDLSVPLAKDLERELHRTIRSVTSDIDAFHLNTVVSHFMALLNVAAREKTVGRAFFEAMARMLQPFAPHFAEELWAALGHSGFVFQAGWPEFDPQLCEASTVTLAVQVNGKTRGTVEVPKGADKDAALALAMEAVPRLKEQGTPVKVIYVPGRILNLVIKGG